MLRYAMIRKQCMGCGYDFRMYAQHDFCDSCADIQERGGEMPSFYWQNKGKPVASPSLSLTAAEQKTVNAWKTERSVHRAAAKNNRQAAAAWNAEVERSRMGFTTPTTYRRRPA